MSNIDPKLESAFQKQDDIQHPKVTSDPIEIAMIKQGQRIYYVYDYNRKCLLTKIAKEVDVSEWDHQFVDLRFTGIYKDDIYPIMIDHLKYARRICTGSHSFGNSCNSCWKCDIMNLIPWQTRSKS